MHASSQKLTAPVIAALHTSTQANKQTRNVLPCHDGRALKTPNNVRSDRMPLRFMTIIASHRVASPVASLLINSHCQPCAPALRSIIILALISFFSLLRGPASLSLPSMVEPSRPTELHLRSIHSTVNVVNCLFT
jgi:hypothetical protein